MKKSVSIIMLCFCFYTLSAQQISIIPKPASLKKGSGNFILTPDTKIISEASGTENSIVFFNNYLQEFYGFHLQTTTKITGIKNAVILNFDRIDCKIAGAYKMKVDPDKIYIGGDNEAGIFYGIQTLIQLLPIEASTTLKIPCLKIIDSARFAYRGMHLDCGRHFFSVDFIKQYIDFIALHKMNYFHWHLTEDQGWRIEIKKYPLLTKVGGCRSGTVVGKADEQTTATDGKEYCGFYTQEQIRDVVKYAADRYITVLPEIEMPGHSSAATTAYPQLSCFPDSPKHVITTWGVFPDVLCPSDYTINFMDDVLDEVMELFPSKYIHIGGDECPKDYWKKSAFCQQLMKDSGIKTEDELQSYFIKKIEQHVNSKGHAIIGWDEILEGGVAPNATIMSWRGEDGGIEAANQKHDVIMTPGEYVYFDHPQTQGEADTVEQEGHLSIRKVYGYNPQSIKFTADEAQYILGAQGNVWTEGMATKERVEYMIFPRMSALSEVLWTQPANKNWDDFYERLQTQLKRYDMWKVPYNMHGMQDE